MKAESLDAVQPEPVLDLLIAVVKRAHADVDGRGLYPIPRHRWPAVQAEAADFIAWLRRDLDQADEH